MNELWRELWAKSEPYHPLWKHLLDVAAVSFALRNPLREEGWTDESIAWLVGMHDIGKADSVFQWQHAPFNERLLRAGFWKTGDAWIRHERISATVLFNALTAAGADGRVTTSLVMAIAAHHGHWCVDGRGSGEVYEQAQSELARLLTAVVGPLNLPAERPKDLSALGIRLAGHLVLCDWIASNEEFFKRPALDAADEPHAYFALSKHVAVEMVEKLALLRDQADGTPGALVATPRPLQQSLLDDPFLPGLVLIEAPMGEGKTEAAWILLEQWRGHGYHGAYMALPTQATGDALFARYERDYLRKLQRPEKVHLIHGMAWLRDDDEPEQPFVTEGEKHDADFAAQWFRPTRRAMLAAHGAGTVDQFLLAGLNARFSFLRLYGLDRRVLIIDEVHAYDAYMTAILCRGLQWCRALRIPVVLLSATLSTNHKRQLLAAFGAEDGTANPAADSNAAYPLLTHADFDGNVTSRGVPATSARSLRMTPHAGLLGDAEAAARLAEELAAKGQCVCVLVNTVRQAQAVYQALRLDEGEKGLFHARFKTADRQRLAEAVIVQFGKDRSHRPERYVLVATQVVEQSLDVDFDAMVSELAPIDLLLQRSGRLHRHRAREVSPELHVLLPATGDFRFGGTEYVYDRYILLRTLDLLSAPLEVELPREFRPLIEAVYGEGVKSGIVPESELTAARAKWVDLTQEHESTAEGYLLKTPSHRLFKPVENRPVGDDSEDGDGWRASTRLGAKDPLCLFIRTRDLERTRKAEFPSHLRREIVRDLYSRTFRVPSYVALKQPAEDRLAVAPAEGRLRGVFLIPYDDKEEWNGPEFKLKYDHLLGLLVEKAR